MRLALLISTSLIGLIALGALTYPNQGKRAPVAPPIVDRGLPSQSVQPVPETKPSEMIDPDPGINATERRYLAAASEAMRGLGHPVLAHISPDQSKTYIDYGYAYCSLAIQYGKAEAERQVIQFVIDNNVDKPLSDLYASLSAAALVELCREVEPDLNYPIF